MGINEVYNSTGNGVVYVTLTFVLVDLHQLPSTGFNVSIEISLLIVGRLAVSAHPDVHGDSEGLGSAHVWPPSP
jgi:hypothetical protein